MEISTPSPFKELIDFLVRTKTLSELDARIYVYALQCGVVNSGSVAEEFEITQNTAKTRLTRLTRKGFLNMGIREGKSTKGGRRGKPILFSPLSPRTALKNLLSTYEQLIDHLGILDQHCELMASQVIRDEDIWLNRKDTHALKDVLDLIESATKIVKIHSHDCSWFGFSEVMETFKECITKGVPILVASSSANKETLNGLREIGINVITTQIRTVPFCIIDDNILVLAISFGPLNRYGSITTTNRYLLKQKASLFEIMQKESKNQR